MKILVTGGSGWIGGAVCRRLEERGDEAVPFDRSNGLDILDRRQLEEAADGCHKILHLAGLLGTHELWDRPTEAVNVNVMGSMNVLEVCRNEGAGYVGIVMPRVNEHSLYSITKNAVMAITESYRNIFDLEASHVIAYNAFGAGQHVGPGFPQKILPTFACRAWAGVPIPIWGNGQLWTDLVHVDDVARMLVDATDFGNGEVFDAGTGVPLTVEDIAEEVQAITGHVGIEWLPERPGERKVRTEDDYANRRGWSLLDWQPIRDAHRFEEAVLSYQNSPEVERLRTEGA